MSHGMYEHEELRWRSYSHELATNLRTTRTNRRLSQRALADIARISRNQVYNIERNTNGRHSVADPQLSTVYRLALALQVPPASLLPAAMQRVVPVFVKDLASEFDVVVRPENVVAFPLDYIERKRFAARPWD